MATRAQKKASRKYDDAHSKVSLSRTLLAKLRIRIGDKDECGKRRSDAGLVRWAVLRFLEAKPEPKK